MVRRKSYLEHFPRTPWAKPHATVTAESYPTATPAQLEDELSFGQRSRHAVGSAFHRDGGRPAGFFLRPRGELLEQEELDRMSLQLLTLLDEGRQKGAGQPAFTDEPEGIFSELSDAGKQTAKLIAGEDGDTHVWNVRELKQVNTDYKFAHPEHHGYARYVLGTTESAIKNQPGALVNKTPPQENAKSKDNANDVKDGADKNTKVDDAKNDHINTETYAKYDDGTKDDHGGKDEDKEDDEDEDIPEEEAAFLDSVLHELNHISSLRNNDGLGHCPPTAQDDREIRIASADQFTPDNWIPRSPALIRITGQSPMNAEPPLSDLFDAGLITPTRLHYVRSHGAVPHLLWETHALEVSGLVRNPRALTMDEMAQMASINIPVTLACDGNRRKEVNMLKRSMGSNWGAGATSCVYWRGVLVRDVLIACGVTEKPVGERWFIHFEGADEPSEGKYATHIDFEYVMDSTNDVMLAYEMNDRPLHPDHGYPLRSIVPGFVGGRCVKWLKKLWVSKEPNVSHYQIYDNRVLPSFVDTKDSLLASAFFHHDSTACNEQVLQSVICKPAHGERIPFAPPNTPASSYRVQGYAYTGGGRLVQRVELSLDAGRSWRYCFRRFPDAPLRHGRRAWTWVHWYCDVSVGDLLGAEELAVRAFDDSQATQPENVVWNLMGMMNNCVYRVKRAIVGGARDGEGLGLTFQHPTLPGTMKGGWMKENAVEAAKAKAAQQSKPEKEFTLEEFEKHNKEGDAWIVIDNKVYDVSSVLEWHPGGKSSILMFAGKADAEATDQYNGIHDGYANSKRDAVLIGTLSQKAAEVMAKDAERTKRQRAQEAEQRRDFALQKHQWTPIVLVEKTRVSRDSHLLKFRLPGGDDAKLGLPVCQHVQLGMHFADAMVVRQYTPVKPVLPEEEDGTVTLLIKTYGPDSGPFKPGGTMSTWVDCIEVGEQAVDIKGPIGEIEYKGQGNFVIEKKERHFTHVNLLTGGSGVTPDWQLIKAILSDKDDPTKISLISSNSSKEDTLLYEELRTLAKEHPEQFSLWFTAGRAGEDWEYGRGHCNEDVMREHFFGLNDDGTAAFLCGPPGLIKACSAGLENMGFKNGETLFGF